MITSETPRPDPGRSAESPDSSPDHLLPERVRQVHAVCLLLDAESKPFVRSRASTNQRSTTPERPHGFARVLTTLVLLTAAVMGTTLWWWSRSTIHRVADYRTVVSYTQTDATDAVLTTDGHEMLLGTAGGGLHRIDVRTHYLQHESSKSTQGGLLSDDIRRIDRDAQGRLYFLCQQDEHLGLCRATDRLDQWSTLLGVNRFAALDVPNPESEVTAAVVLGPDLWIGTRSGGIGRYALRDHAWQESLTASAEGLLDNRVRDLVTGSDDSVWIATAAGINRYETKSAAWKRFTMAEGLAGSDIARLRWLSDALWYATAAGGLGRIDATGNTTLIHESGWGRHESPEVAAVAADPQSRLWFATHKGEVGRYDPDHRQWLDVGSSPATGAVLSLAVPGNPEGTAWLGTERELLRWKQPGGDANGTWQIALPSGVDQLDAQGPSVVARITPDTDRPFAAVSTTEDGRDWHTVVGGRGLHSAARTMTAVAFDSEQQRLWVATERGLASYDTQSNDWIGDFPLDAAATSRLTDIQLVEGTPILLGTDREIRRLPLPETKWESLLGGGKFEAAEADISAVTRDPAGRLWIGTKSQGLFIYDSIRHRWEPRLTFSKPIEALQASTGMVWLLSQGAVFTIAADRVIQPLSSKLPEVISIAAAPHAPAAVLRCRTGHVYLASDQRQLRTLVGDAAPGWDPTAAPAVGLLNELVVFGGDRPHWYDLTTRHWQPLAIATVTEIVPALGALWLRTSTGVVRLTSDRKLESIPQTESVIGLAGTPEQVVVLNNDGVIRVHTKDNPDWVTLNEAPNGPKASLLQDSNWLAACVGDDLYLSGGKESEAWLFRWKSQQWQRVTSPAGPLNRVLRFLAGGNRIFALDQSGVLHEGQGGAAGVAKGLDNVVAVQATKDVVVATTRNGSVNLRRDDGWQPILGQSPPQPLGTPRRAVAALGGMVIAGTEGTSWLSVNLNDWREMAAPKGTKLTVEEFRSSEDGRALWAISTQRRLLAFDTTAWSWKEILSDKLTVEAATVVNLPNKTAELWVCTQDGAVHHVQGEKVTLWSQPSAAPASPAEIVGIVAVPNGFLAAFAPGHLAFFSALTRTWADLPSPAGKQRFTELVSLGTGAESGCLLRTEEGGVYRSALIASPAWVPVATGVSNLSLQGAVAWAVVGSPASVIQISPKGDVRTVISSSGWDTTNRGAATAVCEVNLEDGGIGLALGFATQLAIYNPATHAWHSQTVPVKSLTPTTEGLLVLDRRGQVAKARLKTDQIVLEPIPTGTRAVTVSSAATGPTWITLQEDGTVSHFDDARLVEKWIGRSWSGNPAQTRIADFAALGQWFFFLDKNGRLHAYDRLARDWQTIEDVSGGKRLAAGATGLWVEAATANQSQLLRLTPQAKAWTVKTASEDVVRWHAGPAGVLLVSKQNGRLREVFLRENGDSTPVTLTVPPGPEEREIVGAHVDRNHIWLRATQGNLWNYRPDTRRWTEFPLDPQAAAETIRFAGDRVWVQEAEHGLWMGQADPADALSWRFTAALPKIKAFDVTADTLIATTGSHVVVRDPQSAPTVAPKAMRDFSTRAWTENGDRLSWLAAHDDALLTVTQSNATARYQLATRRWEAVPPVPVKVTELFALPREWCVVGSKDELLRLQNNQWSAINARSETTWRDAATTYTIDAQGRWARNAAVLPVDVNVAPRIATTTATPVRVHAAKEWLLLELSDGSLWRYDAAAMELTRLVAPAAAGRKRTGLVTAAKTAYFVAEDDRQACSLVSNAGQLMPVALPDALSNQTWTALVHAEGLVLAASQLGVLVQDANAPQLLDAATLTERKSQSKPVEAARHRQSGRWRVSSETPQAPLRLECQFHTNWQPVPMDWTRSRLEWDVAAGGLTVGKHIVLATAAGVVIHSPDEPGLPTQFLPIEWSAGVTPGGRIWSLSTDQCLVRAYDGRKWLLNWNDSGVADLKPYTAPPSAWSITREGEKVSLQADFRRGAPLPVQIDKDGHLDCDTPNSVAVFDDSVWIATAAGLFAYSLDLQELRDAQPFGSCNVLVSIDRKQLFVRRGDGSVVEKDGSKWKAMSEKWDSLLAASRLSARPPGTPLEWKLSLGRDSSSLQKVRYVGRGLSIDTPLAPKRLTTETTDGNRVYTLTPEGLIIRMLSGEWVGLLPLENADGLAWFQESDQDRVLLIQSASGQGWRMKDNVATPVDNIASLLKSPRISWQGRVWQGTLDDTGHRIELRSGTDMVDVLDLKERGFVRDHILTVHWDGAAAWLIGPTAIECRIGNRTPAIHTNPLISPLRVVQDGPRAWLTDDKQIVELKKDGSLGRVLDLADNLVEERAAASALWRGSAWRVARPLNPAGLTTTMEYRNASDQWLRCELEAATGLSWDRLIAAGGIGEGLVVSTGVGDFAISQPTEQTGAGLALWRPLSQPAETTANAKATTHFWTDASGQLWKLRGDLWSRYESASLQWSPVAALPTDQLAERQMLSRSLRSAWIKTATGVEYVEFDLNRQPVRSALSSNGVLPSAIVRAVLPHDKTLWLVTQQDLRQVDATTGELLQVSADASDVTRGDFRAAGAEWFLRLNRGTTNHVFQLGDRRWEPINTPANPFAPLAQEAVLEMLRMRPTADGMATELREASTGDRWHPVKFITAANRFDFQVAQDAVCNGQRSLVKTAAGVTAWQLVDNQWRLVSFHPTWNSFFAPAVSQRLLISGPDNRWEEWDTQNEWQPTRLTADEATVVAQSDRWSVKRRESGHGEIGVRVVKNQPTPTELPLDARGDFDFHRPWAIAATSDGTVWTASHAGLTQFDKVPRTDRAPNSIATFGDPSDKPVTDLFVVEDATHAVADGKLIRFQTPRGWESAPDRIVVEEQRRKLTDGNFCSWSRGTNGRLVGTFKFGDSASFAAQWDVTTGRFQHDQVQFAAAGAQDVWFSHPAGLSRVTLKDGQLDVSISMPSAPRLVEDRQLGAWLVDTIDAPKRFAKLEWDADKAELADIGALSPLVAGPNDLFLDTEWRFSTSGISWRDRPTQLMKQHFAHDHFQSLAQFDQKIVTATPTGMFVWDPTSSPWSMTSTIPTPIPDADWVIEVDGAQTLRAIDRKSKRRFEWTLPDGPWREAGTDATARTPVDTPRWKWHQDLQGRLTMHLHATDQPLLEPFVNRDGRFPWDDVTAALCDGDAVWTGGRNGIVRRSLADGEPQRWYQTGADGDQTCPLTGIVQLGRFDTNGVPVVSWDRPERLATAMLLALDENKDAWRFEGSRETGRWQRMTANPWSVPGGQRQMSHPLVETLLDPDGKETMRYTAASSTVPVLHAGRFSIDTVNDIALTDDGQLMLATPAGVVLAHRDTAAFQRLWSDSSAPDELREARHIVRASSVEGRPENALWVRSASGSRHEYDPAMQRWKRLANDDNPVWDEVLVQSEVWTWTRDANGVAVQIHPAEPAAGPWPLFHRGQFSFDVLRDFRLRGEQLVAATPGGIAWFDADTMQLQRLDRSNIDADTGQTTPLLTAVRFAGDGSLDCFDANRIYRFNGKQWNGSLGQERLSEHSFASTTGHWQVQPTHEGPAGGFHVLQFDKQGLLISNRRILPGVAESRLKRVVPSAERLWLCLDRGVYFVDAQP